MCVHSRVRCILKKRATGSRQRSGARPASSLVRRRQTRVSRGQADRRAQEAFALPLRGPQQERQEVRLAAGPDRPAAPRDDVDRAADRRLLLQQGLERLRDAAEVPAIRVRNQVT